MCKRIFKEQTTEQGDVPFYKIGTFGGTPDAFISRELFDEYQRLYQFPKVGDILISAAGTIGRTIVYQGDPAYYQDSNIVWLQHDERLDNGFLLQFLNGKSWSSLEGSTLKRLYNKDLLNAEIAIPSPDEQHQIGSTFARLDDIITLHQRMCSIFCFCAHGSRINFASILQGQLRILRYLRPMPKMRASPSALASGTTDIAVALSFSVLSPLARRPARQGRTPSLA